MKPCPRCSLALRPSTAQEVPFPGDANQYPYACDPCGLFVADDFSHDWQPSEGLTMPPAHCRACGADLAAEVVGMTDDKTGAASQEVIWVDVLNGDSGGVYDFCPDTPNHEHEPRR